MIQTSDSFSDGMAQLDAAEDAEKERLLQHMASLQRRAQHFSLLDERSQAEFFQQLIELLPIGIVVHINGVIVMANPAAMAIMGVENPEEFMGKRVMEFVHADSHLQAAERVELLLQQPETDEFTIVPFIEETLLTAQGEPFEAEVAGIRMAPTEDGIPILVLFRDITEQKRQRKALEASESRFRHLVGLLPDGVIIHKNKEIVFVNDAVLEMMKVENPEELIGRSIDEFLLPEERDFVESRIQQLLNNWEALPLSKNHLRRPSGETFLVEVRAFPFEEHGEKAILLVIRDITEMERMRVELEKNEAKFRLLADLLPALVYLVDENGKIIYMNRFAYNALGYTFEELREVDFFEIIAPHHLTHCKKVFHALKIGESTYDELTVRDKQGALHWVAVWITKTIMDEKVVGLGVAMDITWRKEMEAALKSHTHRLVTALEEERRRMANELHDEVGQQLIGMKFAMERALHHAQAPEARRSIEDALLQLSSLTDQVRELSLSFRPAMLDNLGLLHTLLWHFKRYSARTGIQVRFNHSGLDEVDLPQSYAITVYRVVQEALTNIARYAQTDKVVIEIQVTDHRLVLSIQDDGVGFDPEEALRDFQSSGLRGMKERVHLLSGSLDIRSAPQEGTTIFATIPLPPLSSQR